jgi:copper resistance protein B
MRRIGAALLGCAVAAAGGAAAWGEDDAASHDMADHGNHDRQLFTLIDRFEGQWPDEGGAKLVWDAQGWYGGDINKLWWKSKGDIAGGKGDAAELQLLYSRAVTPFFDLQAGVRQDFEPNGKTYGVLGVQGLAPYWFDLEAAAFVSAEGDVTARIEAEYELLLTQRLILQPRAELELAASDVPDRHIASGFTDAELGMRLRYEIRREIAPYVGVSWTKSLGDTANLVRAAGEKDEATALVTGIRLWF